MKSDTLAVSILKNQFAILFYIIRKQTIEKHSYICIKAQDVNGPVPDKTHTLIVMITFITQESTEPSAAVCGAGSKGRTAETRRPASVRRFRSRARIAASV